MSKATIKAAIRVLPALRASLIWHKRETVRTLRRLAQEASTPRLRAAYEDKARRVASADLADLRASYQAERVGEIREARRFELGRAVPGIVWLEAQRRAA